VLRSGKAATAREALVLPAKESGLQPAGGGARSGRRRGPGPASAAGPGAGGPSVAVGQPESDWLPVLGEDLGAPEAAELYRSDRDLFWRLRPDLRFDLPDAVHATRGEPIRWELETNANGYRGPRAGSYLPGDGPQFLELPQLTPGGALAREAAERDRFWNERVAQYRYVYLEPAVYQSLFADPVWSGLLRYLMIEPVRPNRLGHRLIAEAIAARLSE